MNRFIATMGARLLALGCLVIVVGTTIGAARIGYEQQLQQGSDVAGAVAFIMGLIVALTGCITAALVFGPLAALYDIRDSIAKLASKP